MTISSKAAISPAPGFLLGKDIDLAALYDPIAVDQHGGVHCFVGYLSEVLRDDLPYFSVSVAVRTPKGRESSRFIKLSRGTLTTSSFLGDDTYYRLLTDRRLVLPTGAKSYFGVDAPKDSWAEDVSLTQAVFGGTSQEVTLVATSLAKVLGRTGYDLPRVTFSRQRNNRCDLTNAVIPKEFPYLAFDGAQYDWSHVSLHGFYRLLSLTAQDRSPIRAAIIGDGVPETLLNRMIENTSGNQRPLMARDWE